MKRVITTTSLILGLLVAAGAAQAAAGQDRLYNGKSVYGQAVAAPEKGRVVDVSAVKAVNVNCGETVTFQKGGKSFTWKFDTVDHRVVDLRAIAPAGFADGSFKVYVSRNEAERT